MDIQKFFRAFPLSCITLAIFLLLPPPPGMAGQRPCEPELTAVFLVGGIYPGTDLSLDLLNIREVGPATYPSDEQLLQIVTDFYTGMPYIHQLTATAGNFRLYTAQPMDFGAVTIIDIRDGTIVFAAEVIWMGTGDTQQPTTSSHEWSWVAEPSAALPEATNVLANGFWDDGLGSQEYLAQTTIDFIRRTDVVHSFGSCAPYLVTAYIHTPTVGGVDPSVAFEVLIISGHAAPPWGPEPIATTACTWGMVKSLYR